VINAGHLLARIDWVDCNITRCIKLVEAALQHPSNLSSSTQYYSEISHHPFACTGDIFPGIDRVDQGIAECIKLAEATLQHSNSKKPEARTTAFDRDLDDFIDKTRAPRIEPAPI
jgi:hypothetical protein